MQAIYTQEKVNNEIELCEINNQECKEKIEKALLKNRISYFVKWLKPSIFKKNKFLCIICVNDSAKEDAENVIRSICDESGYNVKFLFKRASQSFL